MRSLRVLSVWFLIVCSVSGIAAATGDAEADSASARGLVYGYGVKLNRPYEFMKSEDSKTLYLNGLVYAGPGDKEPPDITVTEEARAAHELIGRAHAESKKGTTYDECLARMEVVYASSPLVKSVRKYSQGLYVRWASDPDVEEVIILLGDEERPEFDRAVLWEQMMTSFLRTVDSGGMVAFGKKYHIFVPANLVPKTVEQIELVLRGTPRKGLDVMDTALRNGDFLDDLYRESEGAEGE